MHHEIHWRSIVKAITWRVIASLTTLILVYIFTGNLALTITLGGIELAAKLIFYYLHERAWNGVKLGKVAKD